MSPFYTRVFFSLSLCVLSPGSLSVKVTSARGFVVVPIIISVWETSRAGSNDVDLEHGPVFIVLFCFLFFSFPRNWSLSRYVTCNGGCLP